MIMITIIVMNNFNQYNITIHKKIYIYNYIINKKVFVDWTIIPQSVRALGQIVNYSIPIPTNTNINKIAPLISI